MTVPRASFGKWIGRLLATTALCGSFLPSCGDESRDRASVETPPAPTRLILPPDEMKAPALAVLEDFFFAPDVASKAKFVRDGVRVLPMMRDYYETREHPFPTIGKISDGKEADFGGMPMVLFEVGSFSASRYPVAVVWDGSRFVVDWESLTAYGTIDWSAFILEKPTAPQEMRVFLLEARGIPTVPGTPEGSAVFRIEHRDHPQPLIATASPELAETLTPMVLGRSVPVTLKLSWQPIGPGGTPVPVILSLVAPMWSP